MYRSCFMFTNCIEMATHIYQAWLKILVVACGPFAKSHKFRDEARRYGCGKLSGLNGCEIHWCFCDSCPIRFGNAQLPCRDASYRANHFAVTWNLVSHPWQKLCVCHIHICRLCVEQYSVQGYIDILWNKPLTCFPLRCTVSMTQFMYCTVVGKLFFTSERVWSAFPVDWRCRRTNTLTLMILPVYKWIPLATDWCEL